MAKEEDTPAEAAIREYIRQRVYAGRYPTATTWETWLTINRAAVRVEIRADKDPLGMNPGEVKNCFNLRFPRKVRDLYLEAALWATVCEIMRDECWNWLDLHTDGGLAMLTERPASGSAVEYDV